MALLRTTLDDYTNPSLKAGYVQAFLDRGTPETLALVDFRPFEGDSYEFNIQTGRGTGMSARDPFSNTAGPTGVGSTKRVRVFQGQMLRDFEVPIHAQKVLSDVNDQTAIQAELSADVFFEEYLTQFLHGDGSFNLRTSGAAPSIVGDNLNGLDYWLDVYSGKWVSGAFSSAGGDNVLYYASKFRDQKVFATATGEPTAVPASMETLTYSHVDNALSLIKGRHDNLAVVTNRKTWQRFLKSLRAAGGNTQQMLIQEPNVFAPGWDGIPWLISDLAGAGKSSVDAKILVGDKDVLYIEGTGENGFIGFSDVDIGRVVTVAGANFAGGADSADHATAVNDAGVLLGDDQTRIEQIIDNRTVKLVHDAAGAVDNVAFSSDEVPVIYILRLGHAASPMGALYAAKAAATGQSYSVDMGEYYGTITGFDLRSLGELQAGGAYVRYRATWDGNFYNENPFNMVRVSNFKLT